MGSNITEHIIRFVGLVLLQVFILNNINFGGFLNPLIYVLFILSLPLETPRALTLILGLILGLTIDIFTRTLGMHTMATIALAYFRPIVLNYIEPRDGYEVGMRANIADFGYAWYLSYSAVLIFAHHLILFSVETFRLQEFGWVLLKTALSTLVSLVFILAFQLIAKRRAIT
mgnify:CR=1 FL=1